MKASTTRFFCRSWPLTIKEVEKQLAKIEAFLENSAFAVSLHACEGEWQFCYQNMEGVFPPFEISEDELRHCEKREAVDNAFRALLQADPELANVLTLFTDLLVAINGHHAYLKNADPSFHIQTSHRMGGEIKTAGCTKKYYFKVHSKLMQKHPLRTAYLRFAHMILATHPEVEAIALSDSIFKFKFQSGYSETDELIAALESSSFDLKNLIVNMSSPIGRGLTVSRQPFSLLDDTPIVDDFDFSYVFSNEYIRVSDLPWIREILEKSPMGAGEDIYAQMKFKRFQQQLQSAYQ